VPRGPKGERRPADVIGNAVHVMRIATGEAEDVIIRRRPIRRRSTCGGAGSRAARAKKLSKAKRSAIAKKAARTRWGKAGRNG